MSSNTNAPEKYTLNLVYNYDHLKRLEWPKDLPGPDHWKLDTNLSGLSNELKEMADRATESAIRFYQKANGSPAPMLRGETRDPDAIHALKIAVDRQDELERAIKPPTERLTELLMSWLQERKRSLLGSMDAVVCRAIESAVSRLREPVVPAEERKMYDDTIREEAYNVKSGKMTDEQVEYLRFDFRCVMNRVDGVWVPEPY